LRASAAPTTTRQIITQQILSKSADQTSTRPRARNIAHQFCVSPGLLGNRVASLDAIPRRRAKSCRQIGMAQDGRHVRRQFANVALPGKKAGDTVLYQVRDTTSGVRDHGLAAGLRLEHAQPKTLALTRQNQNIACPDQIGHVSARAEEPRAIAERSVGKLTEFCLVAWVPCRAGDRQSHVRQVIRQAGHRPYRISDALLRHKPSQDKDYSSTT
jgi:hypothetical protein